MQSLAWLLAVSGALQQPLPAQAAPDSLPAPRAAAPLTMGIQPLGYPIVPGALPLLAVARAGTDSTQGPRPRAFEYSHAYETRLAIHHVASYATIPLFAAEYYLGQKLFNSSTINPQPTRTEHRIVALGLAGLFGVNTVTGVWNLWDGRKNPSGRLRRYVHAALMLASDAGFVATGANVPGRRAQLDGTYGTLERRHRALAIGSMGTALAGYLVMLVWK